MTIDDIKNKINWRQILTHSFATIFFILAARQFTFLIDIGILDTLDKYGFDSGLKILAKDDNFTTRIYYFLLWNSLSSIIGLIVAFSISLTLTLRNKMFWINALIVSITVIIINRLGLLDNKIIDVIFFSAGDLTTQFGLHYKFITNGTILLAVGLLIFFSKRTQDFSFYHKTDTMLTEN